MTKSQGKQRQAHLISVASDSAPTLADGKRRSDHTYDFTRYYTPLQMSGLTQLLATEALDGPAELPAPAVLRQGATVLHTGTKIMDSGYHVIWGMFSGNVRR